MTKLSSPRVVMVSGSAPPVQCGVGDYTACLVRALAEEGISISLITSECPTRTSEETGLRGIKWSSPVPQWKWPSFRNLREVILREEPDLLHVQFPTQTYDNRLTTLLTQWFRRWLHRPVVVTVHEHISWMSPLNLMMVQAANAVVSVRPDFKESCRRFLNLTAAFKPFFFIPNASSIPEANPTFEEAAALRSRLGVPPGKSLVAYFGLIYPRRGVEQLFQIVDPAEHHLVVIGGTVGFAREYGERVTNLARSPAWAGRATMTGFLPDEAAAAILACADAVVLPFTGDGGGIWNTSIHAARLQRTFVVTTSRESHGYDSTRNVYWAKPDDIDDMREALRRYLGTRQQNSTHDIPRWDQIARQHREIYENLIRRKTA